ncbi:hypothetical protein ACLB1G_01405 [Oxalobacteraceae bacterium A2-2]
MGAAYWIKRYLLAAVPLFAILAATEWAKGTTTPRDILSAAVWAMVAAAIFTGVAYRRYRNCVASAELEAARQATAPAQAKPKKKPAR